MKSGVSGQGSGSGVWIELWGSPTTPAQVSRRWMEYEDRRAMHSSRALWQMAQLRLGPKASRLPPNTPAPLPHRLLRTHKKKRTPVWAMA